MRLLEVGFKTRVPFPGRRFFCDDRFDAAADIEMAFRGKYVVLSRDGDNVCVPISNVSWFVPAALPESGPARPPEEGEARAKVSRPQKNKARPR